MPDTLGTPTYSARRESISALTRSRLASALSRAGLGSLEVREELSRRPGALSAGRSVSTGACHARADAGAGVAEPARAGDTVTARLDGHRGPAEDHVHRIALRRLGLEVEGWLT